MTTSTRFANERNHIRRDRRMQQRRGSLLVWCAFLLVVLLGLAGLVIDGGLLMASHRHAQNAADAAAMEAAFRLLRGEGSATAIAAGTTYVTSSAHNGLPDATVVINIPPSSGPYAGSPLHAEALVTSPRSTFFIHVLPGFPDNVTVHARAVAGSELVILSDGVIALDPNARPGLKLSGQAALKVQGRVVVNSEGNGVDENGDAVLIDTNQTATTVNNNGILCATVVDIVGGVNKTGLDNIDNIDPTIEESPLNANQPPESDPLLYLPTPDTTNGVVDLDMGSPQGRNPIVTTDGIISGHTLDDPSGENFIKWVDGSGDINYINYVDASGSQVWEDSSGNVVTAPYVIDPATGQTLIDATTGQPVVESSAGNPVLVLHPGIYSKIKITGGTVELVSGIYVLSPDQNVSFSLEIVGGDVTAEGIMFYNTGDNYEASGSPDNTDNLTPNASPPPPDGAHFADMKINDSVRMSGLNTSVYSYPDVPANISAFDGLLFYQRRLSDSRLQIEGNSADAELYGTIYMKWGELKIDGQGTYYGSFVVGSLKAEGQGTMTIVPDLDNGPRALKLFLVE